MGKQLNPAEKEMLILTFKRSGVKMNEFADAHNISRPAFKTWCLRYEENGIEGLCRASKEWDILPQDPNDPINLKRKIIEQQVEISRLKKGYAAKVSGKHKEFVILRDKNSK